MGKFHFVLLTSFLVLLPIFGHDLLQCYNTKFPMAPAKPSLTRVCGEWTGQEVLVDPPSWNLGELGFGLNKSIDDVELKYKCAKLIFADGRIVRDCVLDMGMSDLEKCAIQKKTWGHIFNTTVTKCFYCEENKCNGKDPTFTPNMLFALILATAAMILL